MHANMLACVAQYENSIQWFYNYYIQLCIGKYLGDGSCFINICAPQPWRGCPWLHSQKIDRSLVEKGWNSTSEFMIDCIDSGNYIYLYLDQFYIPDSWAFQTQHFPHDTFIYGYDSSNNLFNIADFYQFSKYSFSTASFSQIDEAAKDKMLLEDDDQLHGIVLVKPTEYNNFYFDVKALRGLIEDYLQSKLSSKSYTDNYRLQVGDNQNWWAYGLNIYSYFLEHLEMVLQQKGRLEIKVFQVLVDHKTLMLSRIKYLAEHQHLTSADSIYEEFKIVLNEFITLRNLAIKSQVTGNPKGIHKIIGTIPELVKKEKVVLEKLLDNLVD
jgi:hypothetical protein